MANVNCLLSMQCPRCRYSKEILIRASVWVLLTDDGTEPYADSTKMEEGADFDDDSKASCPKCGYSGELHEWYKKEAR